MKTESKSELLEKFAEILIALHSQVQEVVRNVPDEDLSEVVAMLRGGAEQNSTRNFPSFDYARLAELVESESHSRYHFRRAKELGCDVYCVTHAGDIKDCAHLHED